MRESQAALGTTQYPTATDALNALSDPNSAASRFTAFEGRAKVDQDATFNRALSRANLLYPNQSDRQSNALGQWDTDIDNAHADLIDWTFAATNWQDMQETTAAFQAREQQFQRDINRARADVTTLLKVG